MKILLGDSAALGYHVHSFIWPFFSDIYFYFTCMSDLVAYMYMHMCAWYSQRLEKNVRFSEPGDTNGCEAPSKCWADPGSSVRGVLVLSP